MHHYRNTLTQWIPLAITITAITGLIYLSGQQQYRSMLNDPQLQLAQDSARLIEAGVDSAVLAPKGSAIEISASLAPWIAFYNTELEPQGSTGLLHGTIPQLPEGVFAAAKAQGEEIVTWEPEAGVRQAVMVVSAGEDGYVVAGRNMSAVEGRIRNLGIVLLLGWIIALAVSVAGVHFAERLARRVV
ncbi:MAG: hypothetical protein RLZZ342_753 [Candidatus Parcubacteria bacterium]|jgi:hypothetical protein